ncbi:Cobalt uptake protein COT1 [Saitozyma sp. JCM 24511]|nr:Cobalt uptake protein COT1 [Saitozyma sp. JCM 24511]
MGLSRQARIITLLVIDSVFFLIELITGYAVGSLALVADSFHMLNDVLSLIVALYTIKLATSPSSSANSYGWQRAEILGALINGVFLIALCVSIFLEAIGRIVSPPEITNPKLIVVVGSLGLLSNIVGLFLFHEHGHSHDHGHSHGAIALPEDDEDAQEIRPSRARADSMSSLYQHPAQTRASVIETAHEFGYGKPSIDESSFSGPMSPPTTHGRSASVSRRAKHGSVSRPRTGRQGSASAIPPVPGTNEVLPPPPRHQHAHVPREEESSAASAASTNTAVGETSPNGRGKHVHTGPHKHKHAGDASEAEEGRAHDHDHAENGQDAGGGGHGGHSHGSMNMRGVFLHVMGDALGNIGVISAGLVIWFCQGRWTLYFDPAVSLLITCIIFSSALPLVRSASYILLQGVPSHVSLEDVRESIKEVDGVVSVHELHVWQLSESTIVSSVHVLIAEGTDYMVVANGIREAMHGHGIHSVTIQPEFYSDTSPVSDEETACLIRCPPEQCGTDITCCPAPTPSKNGTENGDARLVDVSEHDEHDHDHDHGPSGHSH